MTKTLAMLLLLLLVSQHASGVEVYEGAESVLLPCHVPADVSRNCTAVVWNRDEFTNPKVHMRKLNSDDLANQNNRYTNRTSMRSDTLQTGDLSLTLRNPTVSDSGTYTCTTRRFGKDQYKTEVQLKVSEPPPPPPAWPIVVAFIVPVVFLLLLAVLYGVLMYRAHKKVKNRAGCMLKPEKVTEGAESVRLPWREGEDLSAADRVKWTRVQPTRRKICECVKDQTGQWELHPHDGYEDRIEMARDHMTNGDFSLTLMKPRCEDGGLYLCVVYGLDEKPRTLTIVVLWVKETWETTITSLFLCGEDTAPPTNEQNEEVDGENAPVMLESSDGKWTLSVALSMMIEDLYGRENV